MTCCRGKWPGGKVNICIFYLVFFSPSISFTPVSDLSMVKHGRVGCGGRDNDGKLFLAWFYHGLRVCSMDLESIGSQLVFCWVGHLVTSGPCLPPIVQWQRQHFLLQLATDSFSGACSPAAPLISALPLSSLPTGLCDPCLTPKKQLYI